jgi:protein-S-isoprenylcysteine O-methyltransferase Ste14
MIPWFLSLPLLLIGGTVALYWHQVLRMARKQRKRTGKAANLVPPEALGRALRILWVPAVVLWIVHPIASAFWSNRPSVARPIVDAVWTTWLGAAVVMAGFLITRRCWKQMGKNWRMGIDPGEKTALVFEGLFGYVRHPIYALSALMMFATVVAWPTPVMIVVGVVHIGLLFWESAREERHLVAVHGEAYAAYQKSVGRLIPRSTRSYRSRVDPLETGA